MAGLKHGLMSIKSHFELLGLAMERVIVHQHLFAKEIYLPMEVGRFLPCSILHCTFM